MIFYYQIQTMRNTIQKSTNLDLATGLRGDGSAEPRLTRFGNRAEIVERPFSKRSAIALELRVKMERGRNELYVLRDVFRKVVRFAAPDVLGASRLVAVDVVLRLQQALRLRHAHVRLDPVAAVAQADPRRVDALRDQPLADGVDRLGRRAKRLGHLLRRPVLAVVG